MDVAEFDHFADEYLRRQAPEDLVRFLRFNFPGLRSDCGEVVGLRIAIPRLIPMDKVA